MRYKGKTLRGPKTETLVIPRESEWTEVEGVKVEKFNDIVFQAQAVIDFDDFMAICPEPKPPQVLKPGGVTSTNPEDPEFKKQHHAWLEKRRDWMILKSLEPSKDVEWDQVKMDNPDTYSLYEVELAMAGFNKREAAMIVGLALKVNSVDEDKMEEARQRFFSQQEAKDQA